MRVTSVRDLGDIIRLVRRQRHLTQSQLAANVGVSREWISNVERGTKDSTEAALVLRTLNALDITVDVHLPAVVIPAATAEATADAHPLHILLQPGGGELP